MGVRFESPAYWVLLSLLNGGLSYRRQHRRLGRPGGRPRREANEWLAELVLYSNLKLHATAYTYYEIPRMLCSRTKIRHNLGAPE